VGYLFFQSKQYDEALKYLLKAQSLDSTSAEITMNIGTAMILRDKDFKKALPYYLKAIELDSNNVTAHSNTAVCYLSLRDTAMALKYDKRYKELKQSAAVRK